MSGFFRTFWQAGLPFGILMGLVYTLLYDWKIALIFGVFTGIFFGLIMASFAYYQSRKFTQNRPLNSDEKLIQEGPANHRANGGWIYLTDSRFFYVSHKVNIKARELSIPLSEIISAGSGRSFGLIPNKLILNLRNGNSEGFVVQNAENWVSQIKILL